MSSRGQIVNVTAMSSTDRHGWNEGRERGLSISRRDRPATWPAATPPTSLIDTDEVDHGPKGWGVTPGRAGTSTAGEESVKCGGPCGSFSRVVMA